MDSIYHIYFYQKTANSKQHNFFLFFNQKTEGGDGGGTYTATLTTIVHLSFDY